MNNDSLINDSLLHHKRVYMTLYDTVSMLMISASSGPSAPAHLQLQLLRN